MLALLCHHRKGLEAQINARRAAAYEISIAVGNRFSKDPKSRDDLFPPLDFGADDGVGDTDTERFVKQSLDHAKEVGIELPPGFRIPDG